MMKITPHQYQLDASNAIHNMLQRDRAVLLVSPISSGKTFIASHFIDAWKNQNAGDVLVIVNRVTLILQTYETMEMFGDDFAIIHGELTRDLDGRLIRNIAVMNKKMITGLRDHNHRVLITTVETLKNVKHMMPDFNPSLIVFDEAHKATSEGYQIVRDWYAGAKILGLTATPYRANISEGECLYEDWYGNNIIETISIADLIKIGQLVQPIYLQKKNTDHVIDTWFSVTQNQNNKRTLVFCQDTAHAMEQLKAFQSAGVACAVITTSTEMSDDAKNMTILQRNREYKAFREGKIDVLISIMALCEGFNEPLARYCFLLRSIGGEDANNPAFYIQTVGRILRPAPGKNDGIIVDFNNNVSRYGKVEDWEWDITDQGKKQCKSVQDGERMLVNDVRKVRRLYVTCGHCSHVYDRKKIDSCTHCGTKSTVKFFDAKYKMHRVHKWMEERINANKDDWGRAPGLLSLYNGWAKKKALPTINEIVFGECMKELVDIQFCERKSSKGIWYKPTKRMIARHAV